MTVVLFFLLIGEFIHKTLTPNFCFQDDIATEKKDPTHYSELDPKSMNVSLFIYKFIYQKLLSVN